MPGVYQQLRSYSPLHDCDVVRVSMTDERNQELFMLVPDRGERRRPWRVLRAAALDAIGEALAEGLDPGEVRVQPDVWESLVAEVCQREARGE